MLRLGPPLDAHCSNLTEPFLCLCLPTCPQLAQALGNVDSWQYDSFHLDDVSGGKPLSCMAFHLMKKMDLVKKFHLDETKLAR